MSLHGGTQTQDRCVTGLEVISLAIDNEKWVPVLRHFVETSVTVKDLIGKKKTKNFLRLRTLQVETVRKQNNVLFLL